MQQHSGLAENRPVFEATADHAEGGDKPPYIREPRSFNLPSKCT